MESNGIGCHGWRLIMILWRLQRRLETHAHAGDCDCCCPLHGVFLFSLSIFYVRVSSSTFDCFLCWCVHFEKCSDFRFIRSFFSLLWMSSLCLRHGMGWLERKMMIIRTDGQLVGWIHALDFMANGVTDILFFCSYSFFIFPSPFFTLHFNLAKIMLQLRTNNTEYIANKAPSSQAAGTATKIFFNSLKSSRQDDSSLVDQQSHPNEFPLSMSG